LENLKSINFEGLRLIDQNAIAAELIEIADNYLSEGEFDQAKDFYNQVVLLLPSRWQVFNKLERIERLQGKKFFNIKNTLKQFVLIISNFNPAFVLVNNLFNLLFFSSLLVFFIFSLFLFGRYFKLAGNDLWVLNKANFSLKRVIIVILFFIWPVFMLSGWMIYPFLIVGFLWIYLNENEKKTVISTFIVILIVSFIYSFNLVFENSIKEPLFTTIQEVYNGKLAPKEEFDKFDDDLKVIQALSYYENGKYDIALDILLSTQEGYKNEFKYLLMGNIYYQLSNLNESINFLRESLSLNEKNPVTLNNITLMLLKKNDLNQFEDYAKRFPEIDNYKNHVYDIKLFKRSKGFLWKRLLSFPMEKFNLFSFSQKILLEFLKLPVLYFIILLFIYISIVTRIFPKIGKSTYCSKCSKIIKKAAIHKSHILCEECYQLFLIKDVIFLEAKLLKEQELNKKSRKRQFKLMLLSVIIPGLSLNYKENNRLFIIFSWLLYFLCGFTIMGMLNFNQLYSLSPLFLNFIGFSAVILYFFLNLFSIQGDEHGF